MSNTEPPAAPSAASSGPATAAEMWELHRAVAAHLLDALNRGPVKASMLDVCRAFLRDNNINVPSQDARGLLRGLAALEDAARFPFKVEE